LKLEDFDDISDYAVRDGGRADTRLEQESAGTMTLSGLPRETGQDSSPGGVTLDSLDITPVGKDSVASDVLSSQWQMDSGLWDEVATKIDLARAYMEMEDPEAARVILEEVVAEGNDEQKAEAKEMLSRLD
jgi:pilus assembly protein FimV